MAPWLGVQGAGRAGRIVSRQAGHSLTHTPSRQLSSHGYLEPWPFCLVGKEGKFNPELPGQQILQAPKEAVEIRLIRAPKTEQDSIKGRGSSSGSQGWAA